MAKCFLLNSLFLNFNNIPKATSIEKMIEKGILPNYLIRLDNKVMRLDSFVSIFFY
jgi:hypothetical protein